jgi:hypothetical protein
LDLDASLKRLGLLPGQWSETDAPGQTHPRGANDNDGSPV